MNEPYEESAQALLMMFNLTTNEEEILMASARLFHVSCVLPEGGTLWELLRSLENNGCANVEVTPVTGPVPAHVQAQLEQREEPKQLVAREPEPFRIKAPNQQLVFSAMRLNEKSVASDLAARTGLTLKQTHMALWHMEKAGRVKRPEIGVYILIRDPRGARR